MPQFDNIDMALAYIQHAVNETLQDEVLDEVTTEIKANAVSDVYASYSPIVYERRGSLIDDTNIVGELESSGTLVVKNIAQPSPSVIGGGYVGGLPTTYGESTRLTRWITEGAVPNIFNSNDYPWMHPRDFIQHTVDELNSGKANQVLQHGLKKRGVNATVNISASK